LEAPLCWGCLLACFELCFEHESARTFWHEILRFMFCHEAKEREARCCSARAIPPQASYEASYRDHLQLAIEKADW
jgi:hypothetical protein